MMIGIYRKTSDSKGNIFTSDIMEIDRSLITKIVNEFGVDYALVMVLVRGYMQL